MKKIFHSIFILLLPVFLFGQEVVISDEIIYNKNTRLDLIGKLKGQVLLFHDKAPKFEVMAFDKNLQESWTKEIDLDKRVPKILGTLGVKDHFFVFYTFRRKSHLFMKVHKYSPAANLADSITIKDLGFRVTTPDFETLRSEDKSKILFYNLEDFNKVEALVFDVDSMQLLWHQRFAPDDYSHSREFLQVLIDNDGNMRMITEKNNFHSNRKDHFFEIFEIKRETKQLNQYKVSLGDKLSYDVVFENDNPNNKLVAGGFYSERNHSKAKGFYYLSINVNNPDDRMIKFTPFSPRYLENLEGKKVKKLKGLIDIEIQELVLRRDGGILMVAEKHRAENNQYGTNYPTYRNNYRRLRTEHFYDDIFVISIHPDGKEHWGNILPKKQYSQEEEAMYASYFLFRTAGSLHFLFNDEIKYENTVSEYLLGGRGDFERNSIMNTENLEVRLQFVNALQLNSREILIPSEWRNQLKLVELRY